MIALAASVIMFLAVRGTTLLLSGVLVFAPKVNQLVMVLAGMAVGVVCYGMIVVLFRLEESRLVLELVKRKLPGIGSRF